MDKEIQSACADIGSMRKTYDEFAKEWENEIDRRNAIRHELGQVRDDLVLDTKVCAPLRKSLRVKVIEPPVLHRKFHIYPSCVMAPRLL